MGYLLNVARKFEKQEKAELLPQGFKGELPYELNELNEIRSSPPSPVSANTITRPAPTQATRQKTDMYRLTLWEPGKHPHPLWRNPFPMGTPEARAETMRKVAESKTNKLNERN